MFELTNVSRRIDDQWVLKGITLQLPPGRIYGFEGRNGSGKTMLFRAMLGLIRLTEGEVRFESKKVDPHHTPQGIGLLLEHPAFLNEMSGRDNLKFLAMLHPEISEAEIDDVLRQVGLSHAAKKKFGKYSLGMKQRLGVAAAAMGKPKWIFLDEPTIALDERGVRELGEMVQEWKRQGSTVVMSSHEGEFLRSHADVVFRMREGELVDTL